MTARKARATDPPRRIFLCVGDLMDEDTDFHAISSDGEVSWCTTAQDESDVEYRLVKPARHRKRLQPREHAK